MTGIIVTPVALEKTVQIEKLIQMFGVYPLIFLEITSPCLVGDVRFWWILVAAHSLIWMKHATYNVLISPNCSYIVLFVNN